MAPVTPYVPYVPARCATRGAVDSTCVAEGAAGAVWTLGTTLATQRATLPIAERVLAATNDRLALRTVQMVRNSPFLEGDLSMRAYVYEEARKAVAKPAVQVAMAATTSVVGGVTSGAMDAYLRYDGGRVPLAVALRDGATTGACTTIFGAVGATLGSPTVVGAAPGAVLGATVGAAVCPGITSWLQDTFSAK